MLGLSGALWACAALSFLLSAVVLLEPQVRRLTRRPTAGPTAADAAAQGAPRATTAPTL
ncbi:hypothetical protein ACWC5I_33030 [Kitasatospora sp. NPDC001574]